MKAAVAGVIERDPLRVAEEVRAGLVEKKLAYEKQMEMMGRLVGLVVEGIADVDKRIGELRKNGKSR